MRRRAGFERRGTSAPSFSPIGSQLNELSGGWPNQSRTAFARHPALQRAKRESG